MREILRPVTFSVGREPPKQHQKTKGERNSMSMKRSIGALTAAMGLAVASSTTAFAFGNHQTEKVKLEELPPAVQNAINQHTEGGKVKRIERTTENGQTFYQVSVKA